MIDFETLVAALRNRGYRVDEVIEVPENAGTAELRINGDLLTLEQARALLGDPELT